MVNIRLKKYSVFLICFVNTLIFTLILMSVETPPIKNSVASHAKSADPKQKGKPCAALNGLKGIYNADGVCGPAPACKKAGQSCIWPECLAYPCPYYFYVSPGVCDEKLVCIPNHHVPITDGDG